jgi:hypothetical protein
MLFYILWQNCLNKSCIYFKDLLPYIISGPYIECHISVLPPDKFLCIPYCYYWLQEIKKYKVVVASSGKTFIPNVMKIGNWFKSWKVDMHRQMETSWTYFFFLRKWSRLTVLSYYSNQDKTDTSFQVVNKCSNWQC